MNCQRHPSSCAILATSFGFGPVSKAVTIARELRRRAPGLELHFFGAGIDYDFAERSNAFDRLIRSDTDSRLGTLGLSHDLLVYDFVIAVLNFGLLELWSMTNPPLYIVDSLAWLWPTPPPSIVNASAYFVQAYLVPTERIESWRELPNMVVIGPIRPMMPERVATSARGQLLVNFSGCSNPFAQAGTFEKYVEVLSDSVLRRSQRFERTIICCNDELCMYLRRRLPSIKALRIGHLSHDEFLSALARASLLLSSPGITATLEAEAAGTPTRFLLPQNYSQALMAELYHARLGARSAMALSRFSPSLAVPAGLPEHEGVEAVLNSLGEILRNRVSDVDSMIDELILDGCERGTLQLPRPTASEWQGSGQEVVVDHILREWGRAEVRRPT